MNKVKCRHCGEEVTVGELHRCRQMSGSGIAEQVAIVGPDFLEIGLSAALPKPIDSSIVGDVAEAVGDIVTSIFD